MTARTDLRDEVMRMTHPFLERELLGIETVACGRCGIDLVTKMDAIGRTYTRCPRCDRVSKPQHRPPDEVLVPQTLVRLAPALPPVRDGQLRCQRCATGVEEPRARFCVHCQAVLHAAHHGTNAARAYRPKRCARCLREFLPTGPRALFCEACR